MRILPVSFLTSIFFGVILLLPTKTSAASTIVVNEIAAYEATGYEWIEIYNAGSDATDMADWKFWEGGSNHGLTLAQGADMTIGAGEFVVIAQDSDKFLEHNPGFVGKLFDSFWQGLNEGGEEIGLRDGNEILVELFTYISSPTFSLERRDPLLADYTSANWGEHASGHSAGRANDINLPRVNAPPVAHIVVSATGTINQALAFDASGSSDDADIVSYAWDFGDGGASDSVTTTHAFLASGMFTVLLTVTDTDGATGTTTLAVAIKEPVDPATQKIVINEFVSNPNDGQKEWIELYNTTTGTISIADWTIEDAVGRVLTLYGTITSSQFVAFELSSAKLNNTGDTITLKHADGTVIDRVVYGAGSAPVPQKGNSVARKTDGGDTEADSNDFTETTSPTLAAANLITPAPPQPPPPSPPGQNNSGYIAPPSFPLGSVVINEILADPGDGMQEFVELYNTVGYPIDLTDWLIVDGAGDRVRLSGRIEGQTFFVVEPLTLTLNNGGDTLSLVDPSGRDIDRMAYGAWDDGSIGDNLPAPPDSVSLSRKKDGQDTDIDYNDFALTKVVTKGQTNVIQAVAVLDPLPRESVFHPFTITELYPNPRGSDVKEEFIEIKNAGASTVSLLGWALGDGSVKFYFPNASLDANGFSVWKRETTKIALNNTSGENVFLYDPGGRVADSVQYFGTAKEGMSYFRQMNGRWAWVPTTTPGMENTIVDAPNGPVIVLDADAKGRAGETLSFDASDTMPITTSTLQYIWDFGDGERGSGAAVEHAYREPGVYNGMLTVLESSATSSTLAFVVTVSSDDSSHVGGSFDREGIEEIEIIAISPNPIGSDDAEFVTLFNPNNFAVDISLLQLDDEAGGSKPYTFPSSTLLAAQSSRVFPKNQTKLALNNDTDTVRLLYPDGTLLREARYEKGKEGAEYTRNAAGLWEWRIGGQVIGEVHPPKADSSGSRKARKVQNVQNVLGQKIMTQNFQSGLRVGQRVTVQGIVSVLPGVFGTQYFYIQHVNTSTLSGVQVYMNNKDFPELAVGDVIFVSGEISEVGGEKRVKVRSRGDIQIDRRGESVVPERRAIESVRSDMAGSVLSLEGEVTEIKSGSLYLDDGTDEIKVVLKQGAHIDPSSFALGDTVRIAGILRGREDALELLPRSQDDIEEVLAAQEDALDGEVKGEKIIAVPSGINRYVSVTLIAAAFAGAGLLLRPRVEYAWRGVRERWKK